MNEHSRDALYHHGVIGQKWGIRRYQPYGIGYSPKDVGKYVGNRSVKRYKKALKKLQKEKDKLTAFAERSLGSGSGLAMPGANVTSRKFEVTKK